MQASASSSAAIDKIAGSYKPRDTGEEDPLGQEAFLTMLVTQLQNQDPLSPMEGTDFTAQLAQFSQLEATFNTNKTLEDMLAALQQGSSKDLEAYIGKNVLAEVDSIEVSSGKAVGGFYTLEENADITVNIYNEEGALVRSLPLGQQTPGSYPISWDGLDAGGDQVADGPYRYDVIGMGEGGLSRVQTTIEGEVEGILYANGKPYLQVAGSFVDPDSLIKVWEENNETTNSEIRPTELIGREITAETGVIDFDGEILGTIPGYTLDREDEVMVEIYDEYGNLVKTITEGEKSGDAFHEISWNGITSEGVTAEAGVYSYRVLTKGAIADTTISGDVTGLVYRNGRAFLNVDGALVFPGAVETVE